ncbi:hypothetical protein PBI_BRADSHAW_67 [Rhodococcus phage Bradshaw]|nr:hypothetical protein PBI_BRADSHAW_67 [Rhodococcus phage Bradshaw]
MIVAKLLAGIVLSIAAGLGIGGELSAEITAPPVPLTWEDNPEGMIEAGFTLPGDDNADGVIDEDESGWNCSEMGNKVCGPVVESDCEDWTYVLASTGSLSRAPRVDPSLPICE